MAINERYDTLAGNYPELNEQVKVFWLFSQDWVSARWTGKKFVHPITGVEILGTWWRRGI